MASSHLPQCPSETMMLSMIAERTGKTLGQKISNLRKQRGWTQQELAEKISVHSNHITRLERDKMKPSSGTLTQLVEVFSISPEELIDTQPSFQDLSQDPQLLKTFQMVQELDPEDQSMVVRFVQALFAKKRMEQALHFQ